MQYFKEQRLFRILNFFSVVAILIAVIGILSLNNFLFHKMRKEIGIRKVFGSSLYRIFKVYLKNYYSIIILGNIIGLSMGAYLMKNWLLGFSYRIEIGALHFVIPIVLSIVILILALIYYVVKSFSMKPQKYLAK